jgi:hypothetical protein
VVTLKKNLHSALSIRLFRLGGTKAFLVILISNLFFQSAHALPVKQVRKCRATPQFLDQALGFGSGLSAIPKGVSFGKKRINLESKKETDLRFLAISDRGPNVDGPQVSIGEHLVPSKILTQPDYKPKVGVILCRDGELIVEEELKLKNSNGEALGGLPPAVDNVLSGSVDEVALTPKLQQISPNGEGVDPEGVVVNPDGTFWVVEEYGPSLLLFSAKGRVIKKMHPGNGLPLWLKDMQANRGLEGVALLPSGDLIVALQSARKTEATATAAPVRSFIDVLRINKDNGVVATYRWPLPIKNSEDFAEVKIGDIVAISETQLFAVRAFRSSVTIESVNLPKFNSTKVVASSAGEIGVSDAMYEEIKSHTLLNLTSIGWKQEKTEGLAMLSDGKSIAVISDDDFEVKGKLSVEPDEMVLKSDGSLQSIKPVELKVGQKKKGSGPELWIIEFEHLLDQG